MMRIPSYANQFEKDVKRMRKRGKDLQKLKSVLSSLIAAEQLDERYRQLTSHSPCRALFDVEK